MKVYVYTTSFLLASLDKKMPPIRVYSRSKFFPFRVDSIKREAKMNMAELFPLKMYPFSICSIRKQETKVLCTRIHVDSVDRLFYSVG